MRSVADFYLGWRRVSDNGQNGQGNCGRVGEQVEQARVGQRVRVQGRDEVFVVLRVDRERLVADLLRSGKVRKVEAGVPLTLLSVVGEPMTKDNNGFAAD